jgi:radical SAM protein with 4Fe4S-binding SPASM domain
MKPIHPFREFYDSDLYVNFHQHPLPIFPYLLEIEPTNACNMDCLFCGRQAMERPIAYLDYDIYKKIIDEASQYECFEGISSFSGWGEPLLHQHIFKMIEYANKKNLLTSILTNGLLLSDENIIKLLDSGIDHIKISLQGANVNEYEVLRKRGVYETVVANVKRLVTYRDNNSYKTFIQASTSITDESEYEVKNYVGFWEDIVDEIYVDYTKFQRLLDVARVKQYLDTKKNVLNERGEIKDSYKEKTFRHQRCVDVHVRLVVHSDNTVPICCSDFRHEMKIGNVKDNSLKEIWDSPRLSSIRKILNEDIRKIAFCRLCQNLR